MTSPSSIIVYRGPSQLDGAPIVAIATSLRGSGNRKTGNMAQVWILREDVSPCDASKSGQDSSVCGNCPMRRGQGGACYVALHQAPTSVWRAYRRGSYSQPADISAPFEGLNVRIGAYGDPAAVPAGVWHQVASKASKVTGYTHQWMRVGSELKAWCMASCETEGQAILARMSGWRTFRVVSSESSLMRGEYTCPASAEGGHRTTCAACGACNGSLGRERKPCPAIVVHGNLRGRFHSVSA